MILNKKIGGLPYARKTDYEYDGTKFEADLKNGDICILLNGGVVEAGKFSEQTNFNIQTRNGDKKLSINQSSLNVLIDEFGPDTEKWIGKDVKILLQKGVFAGKKGIATYVVTNGWSLDEYGELTKEGVQKSPAEEVFGEQPF